MVRTTVAVMFVLAACGGSSSKRPDGGTGDGSIDTPVDANACNPMCIPEPNSDVECTVLNTCEQSCADGYSRCGADCVTESPTQCGAGCEPCGTPSNGTATCSGGVCGVSCAAGFFPCDGYPSLDCCPYASELVAPDELGGFLAALDIDVTGGVHVAYYRSAANQIVYAKQTAGGWQRETLPWYWSSGGNAAFEVAANAGRTVIAYTHPNATSALYLAERRANGWSRAKIFDQTPPGFDVAVDRAGRIHVCFTETTGGLHYGIRHGDQWTFSLVGLETEATGACSIEADSNGAPHIAFYRATAADVAYAHAGATGAFDITTVDTAGNVGSSLAIAVGSANEPHIAAYRSDTTDLRYARLASGTWTAETVLTGTIGETPRIAVGSGRVVITYYDDDRGRVAAAVFDGATWSASRFENAARGWGALAAAPDGSFWAATGDYSIETQHLVGSAWTPTVIDSDDTTGSENNGDYGASLLHRNGETILVYTRNKGRIPYVEIATRSSGAWTYRRLAPSGYFPSAVLDGNGRLQIAFVDGTTFGLSYASETATGDFTIETIAGQYASHPSLAIDPAGTPHVVYVSSTTSTTINEAIRSGSGWAVAPIASGGTGYDEPVLRIGSNGVRHVLWGETNIIAYGSSAQGFAREVVEATAEDGHELVLAAGDAPHACVLRNNGSGFPELRHATRATSWSSVVVSPPGTRVNSDVCAIAVDGGGTIGIARALRYGAGLGEIVITKLGAPTTHPVVQDDFYGFGFALAPTATDFELAFMGRPYNGSGSPVRLRWAHR